MSVTDKTILFGSCYVFVQLRIAKVKTSLLGPIDSTFSFASIPDYVPPCNVTGHGNGGA